MRISNESGAIFESIFHPEYHRAMIFTSHSTGDFSPLHWHDALEILYLYEGELNVTTADQEIILSAGNFLLINSRVIHATRCQTQNRALVLQLPENYLLQYLPDIEHAVFDLPFHCSDPKLQPYYLQLEQLLCKMYLLDRSGSDSDVLKIQSLLFELLYLLHQNFYRRLPQNTFLKHTKNLGILTRIMDYTMEHYQSELSIDEIARVAGFQPKYFCRFFKTSMGDSYLHYLAQLRLQFIYEDLLSTDLPIFRILEKHGFSNYKLFRRMFQERFACTPGELRKKLEP